MPNRVPNQLGATSSLDPARHTFRAGRIEDVALFEVASCVPRKADEFVADSASGIVIVMVAFSVKTENTATLTYAQPTIHSVTPLNGPTKGREPGTGGKPILITITGENFGVFNETVSTTTYLRPPRQAPRAPTPSHRAAARMVYKHRTVSCMSL